MESDVGVSLFVRPVAGLAALVFVMNFSLAAAQIQVSPVERLPAVQQALKVLADEEWIMQQQVLVTSIPAPPFHEEQRASYLEEQFQQLGLQDVHRDAVGNVLGTWPGTNPDQIVLLSAHMDTVFPPGAAIEIRQEGGRWTGPGIADNGIGLAALLSLIRAVQEANLQMQASLLFVANVGEEGEGNLRGMKELFSGSDLKSRVRAAVIVDGSTAERLTSKALGSKRFEVVVQGPGGHSWADFGLPNPIQALARAVQQLTSTFLPARPRTTLNIGAMEGGTSVNSIPAEAWMKVDIRSESESEIVRLEEALREAVSNAVAEENDWARSKGGSLRSEIRVIGERPAGELPASAGILRVFRAVDDHLGIHTMVQRSSTDANIPISMGLEAVAVGGGGRSGSSHSLQEWFDPAGRQKALKRILLAVAILAGVQSGGEVK